MKIKLHLDTKSYSEKPSSTEIVKIKGRLGKQSVSVSITDLFNDLQKGKSVILAEFPNHVKGFFNNDDIIQQQVFMLDFDNKYPKNMYTIEDLKKDTFIQENACFYYRTFSDKDSNVDKFRVVFVLKEPVITREEVTDIYMWLFKKYPQSDTSIGQVNRLFFGGTKGVRLSFKNRLNYVPNVVKQVMKVDKKDENIIFDKNTPNYLLFKYKKLDILSEKLGSMYSATFPDEISAMNYFKRINLIDLLELPDENPFLDIIHEESNPSASVYKHMNDTYLYKCFSNSSRFVGDIYMILYKLNGESTVDAINSLVKATNSVMNSETTLGIIKRDTQIFTENLISHDFPDKHPELYKWLKPYIPEIDVILKIMLNHSWQDKETGELKYMSYLSKESLAEESSTRLGYKVTTARVWNAVNTLVIVDALMKLKDEDISSDLLHKLKSNQIDNKYLRRTNVYELSDFSSSNVEEMGKIAKILTDNKVTMRGLSYEMIYRLFDEEKANKVYPQSIKPLIDSKSVKMSNKDKNLTTKQLNMEKTIVKYVMESIESNNYVYEQDILREICKKHRVKINQAKIIYHKIRPELLVKYSLDCIVSSKSNIEKYDLELEFSRKNILVCKK